MRKDPSRQAIITELIACPNAWPDMKCAKTLEKIEDGQNAGLLLISILRLNGSNIRILDTQYGTVRYATLRYGMVWYGTVWYMVWYGTVCTVCTDRTVCTVCAVLFLQVRTVCTDRTVQYVLEYRSYGMCSTYSVSY